MQSRLDAYQREIVSNQFHYIYSENLEQMKHKQQIKPMPGNILFLGRHLVSYFYIAMWFYE
jgi:hypothetical protein